ncbi:hypothetical protein FRC17_010838 [Serendipita sp. 399]|nr:hypothetical protein FRC17_010838 [Serendipita sp. 399]
MYAFTFTSIVLSSKLAYSARNNELRNDIPPIAAIPSEILIKIFKEYTYMANSLIRLRLTCRLWRDIICSSLSLARCISLSGYPSCWEDCIPAGAHCYDYCCRSVHHLGQALELLGCAQFKLHAYTLFELSTEAAWNLIPWSKFTTQCVGIELYSHARLSRNPYDQTYVPFFQRLPLLRNLRFLYLYDNGLIAPSIFSKVDQTTQSLTALEILYTLPDGKPFEPQSVKDMLANLRSFDSALSHSVEFSIDFSISLLSSFRNLKDLTWDGPNYSSHNVHALLEAVDWGFTLDRLETCYSLLAGFPLDPTLKNLRELEIRTNQEDADNKQAGRRLELPLLTSLTLIGSWIGLVQIDAPNLVRLALHGKRDFPPPVGEIDGLLETRLRPKRLDVQDDGNGFVLKSFLLRGPFSGVMKLEMHVDPRWVEGGHLEEFLADFASAETDPQCRNIQQLKVYLDSEVVPHGLEDLSRRLAGIMSQTTTQTIDVQYCECKEIL